MSAFGRDQKRFACRGIRLNSAPDTLPPDKWPFLQNVRSDVLGAIHHRLGLNLFAGGLGGPVHSVFRLPDPTPFASIPARYFFGVGGNLISGPTAGPFTVLDSGYSGAPLSFVDLEPPRSPQPWLYVSDASRSRKVNVNGTVYPIGITAPKNEPDVEMFTIGINLIQSFNDGFAGWASIGDAADAITTTDRVNTTISHILYDGDSGILGGEGNCSIVPADFSQITEGMMVRLDGVDLVQVAQITVAIAPTTIASIIYDSGSTGLCTIQPEGSLGTGLVDIPNTKDWKFWQGSTPGDFYTARGERKDPRDPDLFLGTQGLRYPRHRKFGQQDFPVNCVVDINGELVRILSATMGPDEILSFRCSTTSTHSAGESIEGMAAFRSWVPNTYSAGDSIYDGAVHHTITPTLTSEETEAGETIAHATAGIISSVVAQNLASITVGGDQRPILPDDDLHMQIKFRDTTRVQVVRLYFDVDREVNDFTQNYYFFEWRANELNEALQNANGAFAGTLLQAAQTAGSNQTTEWQAAATGRDPDIPGSGRGNIRNPFPTDSPGSPVYEPSQPGTSTPPASSTTPQVTPTPTSDRLGTGAEQWLDLQCKVGQLIHIGTDTSRTLADVQRVEVLVSIAAPADEAMAVEYDTIYISGGYSVDIGGPEGVPYRYRYSYRSSTTGARSNPSPQTRAGVIPRRQRVICYAEPSSDPQVDLIDWWRIGGALTTYTYVGTGTHATPYVLYDDYGDTRIDGGQTLEFDNYQPFPTTDLPRSGVCTVAGNALRWVSGSQFDKGWAEGSSIVVNGRVYSLYGQPPTNTLLFLNESAGSGTVPYQMTAATLVSDPLRNSVLFGGPVGGIVFTFGVGDPYRPGSLAWTKPNNPEVASDAGFLEITPASQPLLNGCLYDGLPYVFSSEHCYVVEPDFGQPHVFRALQTACGKGLWSRWAMCSTPYGIAFLTDDGIVLSAGGATAVSLTDEDLYPLFPHDGEPGVPVNGIYPPDMSNKARLRLAYYDGCLYFDYIDTQGANRTLMYRFGDKSWWPDVYASGAICRYASPGELIHQPLIGLGAAAVCVPGGTTDAGTPIACVAQRTENQGDGRLQKLYRDLMLELDSGGTVNVTLTLSLTNGTLAFAPVTIATTAGRKAYYTDLSPITMDAYGTNITFRLDWSPVSIAPTPLFYFYDIAGQAEPELSTNWLSGPTTHGLPGFQHVPLAIMCYRASTAITFRVIIDGVTYTYTLPSTGGQYLKKVFRLQAIKGMTFQYGFQAPGQAAFQLFDRDCEIWVQPWGVGGGYNKMKPFSGPMAGLSGQGPGTGGETS